MGLIAFVLSVIALGAYAIRPDVGEVMIQKPDNVQKHKKPFTSPKGIFIQVRRVSEIADNVRRLDNPLKSQERASKQLPGPGQHFSFGALKSWEEIHQILNDNPGNSPKAHMHATVWAHVKRFLRRP
jgi:hypothetical protein